MLLRVPTFSLFLLVFFAALTPALAQPPKQPAPKPAPKLDAHGDPLPPGAIARLGSLRFNHGEVISALAVSHDARLIATGGAGYGKVRLPEIRLWDGTSGKLIRRIELAENNNVSCLQFAPDAKTLAVGTKESVHLFDVATGKERAKLPGHDHYVRFARFLKDGKTLLTADGLHSYPKSPHVSLRSWDLNTGKQTKVWTPPWQETPEMKPGDVKEDCHLVDVSADGRLVAWCCAKGKVGEPGYVAQSKLLNILRVVQTDTGKELFCLNQSFQLKAGQVHTGGQRLCFSPDGKLLALAAGEAVEIRSAESGKMQQTVVDESDLAVGVVFAPDGKTLVTLREFGLGFHNPLNGKSIGPFPPAGAEAGWRPFFHPHLSQLVYSSDGRHFAVTDHTHVRLFDAATRKELLVMDGHFTPVTQLRFAADGNLLASACAELACYWDARNWSPVQTLIYPVCDQHVDWRLSLLGKLSTAGVIQDAKPLDFKSLVSGKVVHSLPIKADGFEVQGLSPDGSIAALVQLGYENGRVTKAQVRFYQLSSAKLLGELKLDGPNGVIKISADNRWATVPDAGKIRAIELTTGKTTQVPVAGDPATRRSISNDGSYIAVSERVSSHAPGLPGSTNIHQLWHLPTGKKMHDLVVRDPRDEYWSPADLAISPDNRTVAFLHGDANNGSMEAPEIRFIDIASGTRRGFWNKHLRGALCLAFAPDGKTLATGHYDGTILIWDLQRPLNDKPIAKGPLAEADLAAHWQTLAKPDAANADTAIWSMVHAPKDSVPFLKKRVMPAQAPAMQQVQQWISELGDDSFQVRQKAMVALEAVGDSVLLALVDADKKPPSLEVHLRLQQLIAKAQDPVPTPEVMRQLRALEVLEHIGSAEAKALLKSLAAGAPAARLTAEAKATLGRLKS